MDQQVGPQSVKTGGEANGEEEDKVVNVEVVVDMATLVVEGEVDIEEAAEVVEVALDPLILLLVTGAGCVAIWPVTVPNPVKYSRREVAMLALLKGNSLNPGKKAQEDVEEVGQLDSGASMSCMTRLGMNTQWTMQDNCTSPSNLNML